MSEKLKNDVNGQFELTSKMLAYIIANFNLISELPIDFLVNIMSRVQWVQTQLKTFELRLREEIIPHFDCDVGKSKSKTDRDMGFKIETKRPVNSKFYPKVTDAEFRKALGIKQSELNDLFPTTRSFSQTSYNKLSEDQQKKLTECIDVKLGQISVKVTAL